MNLYEIFKRIILQRTPETLLQHLRKLHYLRKLKNFSENDEIDLKVVRYIVQPGDFVVDIGANIGAYTVFLSGLIGEDGRVYSIEPIPSTFDILLNNVNRLNLQNVILLKCGISNKNSFAVMEIPQYPIGGENYYQARITVNASEDNSLRKVRVDLRTLDAIFLDLNKEIKFMKIDVEGHELSVIDGGTALIRRCRPALLVEISDDPDEENSMAFELFNKLKKEDYLPYWFDGNKVHLRGRGDKSVNYFFLTSHHLGGRLSALLQNSMLGQ